MNDDARFEGSAVAELEAARDEALLRIAHATNPNDREAINAAAGRMADDVIRTVFRDVAETLKAEGVGSVEGREGLAERATASPEFRERMVAKLRVRIYDAMASIGKLPAN